MTLSDLIPAFLKPQPTHTEVRFVAATKQESALVRSRRTSVVAQLAVYNACTTPEQRLRDTEKAIAELRAKARALQGVRR